jgi:hypothetical protein
MPRDLFAVQSARNKRSSTFFDREAVLGDNRGRIGKAAMKFGAMTIALVLTPPELALPKRRAAQRCVQA